MSLHARRWLARYAGPWLARARRHLRRPDRRRVLNLVAVLLVADLTVAAAGYGAVVSVDAPPEAVQALAVEAPPAVDAREAADPTPERRRSTKRADVFVPADQMVRRRDLPARGMSYERYARDAKEIIARLPSLDIQRRHFPASPMTRDIAAQKEHIAELDARAQVSVEGFADLEIDRSRRRAFVDLRWYHRRIRPKMFIVHWTAMGYRDVDHFVTSLRPYRVQFFMDRDAEVYELFETDRQMPAHARGANEFAQGVEIETGRYDGKRSPLFSYTPEQIEQTVYLAVEFLRRNDLPVDETTLLGHYAADLIFTNPYYEPRGGRFSRADLRKYDPPQELMEVIVRKAKALDAALDAPDRRVTALGAATPR